MSYTDEFVCNSRIPFNILSKEYPDCIVLPVITLFAEVMMIRSHKCCKMKGIYHKAWDALRQKFLSLAVTRLMDHREGEHRLVQTF
jgi:hypothetical protein